MQIRKKFPDSTLIFVRPPSSRELLRRLKRRNTDGNAQIAQRIKRAEKEMRYVPRYDYVVINDRLEDAIREVAAIINKTLGAGIRRRTAQKTR